MSQTLAQTNLADACLVAETWGEEDAFNDIRPRAAEYFDHDSDQWNAYYAGYQQGTELLFGLTGRYTARQLGITTTRPNESIADMQERYGHLFY